MCSYTGISNCTINDSGIYRLPTMYLQVCEPLEWCLYIENFHCNKFPWLILLCCKRFLSVPKLSSWWLCSCNEWDIVQSMIQAGIVFPQGMCKCVNLWNGACTLRINAVKKIPGLYLCLCSDKRGGQKRWKCIDVCCSNQCNQPPILSPILQHTPMITIWCGLSVKRLFFTIAAALLALGTRWMYGKNSIPGGLACVPCKKVVFNPWNM